MDFSGGQPWLVNAIARECVEEIHGFRYGETITLDDVETAKETTIRRGDAVGGEAVQPHDRVWRQDASRRRAVNAAAHALRIFAIIHAVEIMPIVTDTYDFPTLVGEGYVYVDRVDARIPLNLRLLTWQL